MGRHDDDLLLLMLHAQHAADPQTVATQIHTRHEARDAETMPTATRTSNLTDLAMMAPVTYVAAEVLASDLERVQRRQAEMDAAIASGDPVRIRHAMYGEGGKPQ